MANMEVTRHRMASTSKVRQVFRPQLFIATMQVTDEEVDAFFAKLPPGQELELEQPQPRL